MIMNIKRVLVVDDEAELAHAIEIHLSRLGFQILSENTMKAAQKAITDTAKRQRLVDLVITDISMPGNSGIELLQWIQKNHPHISIILISGFGADDLIASNIRPTLDGYCKKPFSPQTLLSQISSIEKGRQGHLNSNKAAAWMAPNRCSIS